MVIYDMEYPQTCGECRIYDHNARDCSICCHGKPIPPNNKRKPHWCPVKGEITNEEWEGVQRGRSNQHLRPDANQNTVQQTL